MSNNSEVFNERQVEEIYGLTIPYLRRARRERRGPKFLKVGKLVRYRKTDIESYLSGHTVETGGLEKKIKAWKETQK